MKFFVRIFQKLSPRRGHMRLISFKNTFNTFRLRGDECRAPTPAMRQRSSDRHACDMRTVPILFYILAVLAHKHTSATLPRLVCCPILCLQHNANAREAEHDGHTSKRRTDSRYTCDSTCFFVQVSSFSAESLD